MFSGARRGALLPAMDPACTHGICGPCARRVWRQFERAHRAATADGSSTV